jgi:hypothetical protein
MSQHEIRDSVSELWSPHIHLNMLQIPKRNHPGIGTMVSGGDLWTPQKTGHINGNSNSRQLTEKKSSMSLVQFRAYNSRETVPEDDEQPR